MHKDGGAYVQGVRADNCFCVCTSAFRVGRMLIFLEQKAVKSHFRLNGRLSTFYRLMKTKQLAYKSLSMLNNLLRQHADMNIRVV